MIDSRQEGKLIIFLSLLIFQNCIFTKNTCKIFHIFEIGLTTFYKYRNSTPSTHSPPTSSPGQKKTPK